MSIEDLIESQIQEAIAAGAFDNLPGAGKPLPPPEAEPLAGTNWLGFKVLQNGGMLPGWLGLARHGERPGIWVEVHVQRLRVRAADPGAPETLFQVSQ